MHEPFTIAADLDTPVSAYLKIGSLRPRYLLESVEGGIRLARYSFIGFGRAREFRLYPNSLHVDGRVEARPDTAEGYLDALRQALDSSYSLEPVLDEVPFAGGLVGYSAFDVVRQFEPIGRGALPDERRALAAYLATESVLVFDHLTRRAALLHAGPEAERDELTGEIRALLRGPLPPARRTNRGTAPGAGAIASLEREDFEQKVRECQAYIGDGDIYQIVLSVLFRGETDVEPFEVYRALRLLNPSPYMFYLDVGAQKIAGSSPEALVKLNGRRASLRPIAGTLPRGRDRAEDLANETTLLGDPKEVAEHVMLVDLARNDLGRVARTASVTVDPYMSVERYSHVMHIVSGVSAELADDSDAFDLFRAAFPAGTLVGAPKFRAMQIIDELEPVSRGLYGGTVGYFARGGDMDQAITIRTIVFDDDRYSFQAGAGIVADSDPAKEYDEVLHKSAILRRALELAAEGL